MLYKDSGRGWLHSPFHRSPEKRFLCQRLCFSVSPLIICICAATEPLSSHFGTVCSLNAVFSPSLFPAVAARQSLSPLLSFSPALHSHTMPVFSNACTRTRKRWSKGVSHLRSLKRRRSGGSVSSRFSGDDLDGASTTHCVTLFSLTDYRPRLDLTRRADIDIPVFDLFFAETLSQPPPPLPTSKTISHWCTRSPYALDFTSYLPLDNVFPSSPLPAKSDSDHSYCPTEVPQTSEISPLSVGGTLDPPHDFGTLFSALLHLDRPSSSSVQQPSLSAHCGQSTVFSATSSFTCDVGLSRWSTETGSDGSEQEEEEDGEHSEGMDESFWCKTAGELERRGR